MSRKDEVDEIAALLDERGVRHVTVAVTDLDGILSAKHLAVEKFLGGAAEGLGFCNVVLGWDSADAVLENISRCGWDTGFPDRETTIDLATGRELPGDRASVLYLADFAGAESALSPRSTLRRTIDRAAGLGLRPRAAFEYEFFLFEETPHSVREKGYRDLKPIAPGAFGYSLLRSLVAGDLYDEILDTCEALRVPLEGLHEESGPGVIEAAIAVDAALEAADRAVLFKTFIKALAQRRGLMATFMSRWSQEWPGLSGHIHVSLQDADGGSAFHDPAAPDSIGETMRHFLGGQQALMPELLAMVAPTVNSYTRLVPGYWAPTGATWGIDNRTCALRVLPGSPKTQRIEYRVAGAEANPYLALAAALGSGLWGIENRVEPSDPVAGNAYEAATHPAFPQTLWEAARRLRQSEAAAQLFGSDFVEHFADTREWEERQFRQAVTDWELERYFEAI